MVDAAAVGFFLGAFGFFASRLLRFWPFAMYLPVYFRGSALRVPFGSQLVVPVNRKPRRLVPGFAASGFP
jgi:hypothetical protein